jgi:signal peptidase I
MNDDSRDQPAGAPHDPLRLEIRPEPLQVPTPEPLVAAEPPPVAHMMPAAAPIATADPGLSEPSWRTLVGAHRDDPMRSRLEHSGELRPLAGPAGEDSTLGTVGDEPMGAAPREMPLEFVPTPADASGSAHPPTVPPRSPSGVTIARVGEELFAWLKTLASAAVYATLIVTFGFQVARVEGQSMAPTLADQDRLIVNKLAYRLGQPQVGDIVMLYYPLNPDKSFVKRVIAEEGDQIRIVDGRVYRNDVPINDDYVPAEYRSHDDWGPEVVPQGYYFVMGDHRNNSSDSRHWKFVPKKYIIGKVQLRWWPIPHARIF